MKGEYIRQNIAQRWIPEEETEEQIHQNYQVLNGMANKVYQFVLAYSYYLNTRRDYGTGDKLTMLEAHIMTDIFDHPGITVSTLAQEWKRSNSSISQVVGRLIEWGYVEKINNSDNARFFNLYVLPKGKNFVLNHKHYDNIDIIKLHKTLLKDFSPEELATFYNVLMRYQELLEVLD